MLAILYSHVGKVGQVRARLGRGLSAVLLMGATLVAMAGCAGVDLADEWPGMAEPTGWEPKASTCTGSFSETSYRSAYSPVDCAGSHAYETVYVGTFTGDAAALPKPPERGSTALGSAWAECDAKTTEYVGAPWRDGKIWIAVSVPSAGNWEGGARWFRCEAAATADRFGDRIAWTSSLKDELVAQSRLRHGCYLVPKEEDKPWAEVACTQQHNAEYVGSFVSTDSYDGVRDDQDTIFRKCLSLVAGYVGVPDDGKMRYRSGTGYRLPAQQDWEAGDHAVRCHLYLSKTKTSSLKGAGTKGLPINYA